MGRAARNTNSQVIMYADTVTGSMQRAIDEVKRRRKIQLEYNLKNNIIPIAISKPIRKRLVEKEEEIEETNDIEQMLPEDKNKRIKKLTALMKQAARDMDFELAAKYRDIIKSLKQ